MRIALCQINPTVGDFESNAIQILRQTERALAEGADLAIFPELSLIGYPPLDLLERHHFVEDCELACSRLIHDLPRGITVAFGSVRRHPSDEDPQIRNSAVVAARDKIRCYIDKQLLPNYDVFDERRYFHPGAPAQALVSIAGKNVGFAICEDAWNHVRPAHSWKYVVDPLRDLCTQGADVLVNLSASPFTITKFHERSPMLSRAAAALQRPIIIVNQVGGNDGILFDGCSAFYNARGEIQTQLAAFAPDFAVVDLAASTSGARASQPRDEDDAALQALILGVRDYFEKTGSKRAVVGLSGGIDSAVVASIAAEALGPQNVLGVAMPTRYSSESSLRDATDLAKNLGIRFQTIPIDSAFGTVSDLLAPQLDALAPAYEREVTYENLQSRLRTVILMALSNREKSLMLNTGNKSEIACGYFTIYGDSCGALSVIGDLTKTRVYRIAKLINQRASTPPIPESTITKEPSAELRPNQKDSDSLPPYDLLDPILELLIEEQRSPTQIVEAGHDPKMVEQVLRLVRQSEYKRKQIPPVLIVTNKAFGPGRRVPVAQRYTGE